MISTTIAYIPTKFDKESENEVPEVFCRQNLCPTTSKMAVVAIILAILKFCLNGHNSAAIAVICTKFDSEAENEAQK